MGAMAIIWPLVVVVIWASVFGLALLLVRMTTRDQQATARAERAAEEAAVHAATESERPTLVAAAAPVAIPALPAT